MNEAHRIISKTSRLVEHATLLKVDALDDGVQLRKRHPDPECKYSVYVHWSLFGNPGFYGIQLFTVLI